MAKLTKQQQLIKDLRFNQNKTLSEVAQIIGRSIQYVWQVEQTIIKKESGMRALMKEINEINRLKYAIKETKSICLKKDYRKKIEDIKNELKEYCGYKSLDFETIKEKYKL